MRLIGQVHDVRPVTTCLAAVPLLAAILLSAGAIPTHADSVLLTVAPRMLTASDADTFLIVVPPRSEDQVVSDRSSADEVRSVEQARLREAIDQEAGVRAKIEVQKQEMEALKAKIKLAKDEKNEEEKKKLEGWMAIEERRMDLLRKRGEVRVAERELTLAAKEVTDALVRYYDIELELLAKRAVPPQPSRGTQDDAALERQLRYEGEVRELERRALEAILLQTEKREELLNKEKKLLERRVELFEAQNAARRAKSK